MRLEVGDWLFYCYYYYYIITIILHHTQMHICIPILITAGVLGDQNGNRVKLSSVVPGT